MDYAGADPLPVSVASAIKEDLPDNALVIDDHIDELRAGRLGFGGGVGHILYGFVFVKIKSHYFKKNFFLNILW